MNIITIAGRIGREPELRHTQSGDAVLGFSIADNPGRNRTMTWWRASLFGKRAEALQPYLRKGDHVTIAGTVTPREYTDRGGQRQMSLDVRVQEIALQGGKPTGTGSDPAPYQAKPKPAAPADDPFGDMDDSIPF